MITGRLSSIARTLTTSAVRMGDHGGVPGAVSWKTAHSRNDFYIVE